MGGSEGWLVASLGASGVRGTALGLGKGYTHRRVEYGHRWAAQRTEVEIVLGLCGEPCMQRIEGRMGRCYPTRIVNLR